MLYGRDTETGLLGGLLHAAADGTSAALLLHGEAGIGKTALLDQLATNAGQARVLRTVGIEAETELPFAALHQLLRPALDRLPLLPGPQADALRAAFGLAAPAGQDRFLTGLAVLTLLSEYAGEDPVLCLVDDAQWLDRPSLDALAFAARRLDAEGVVMVFAMREPQPLGLPELRLDALDPAAADALLDALLGASAGGSDSASAGAPDGASADVSSGALPGASDYASAGASPGSLLGASAGAQVGASDGAPAAGLPPHVRERLAEEAAGNPLALIELPRSLSAEQRTGLLGPLPAAPGDPTPSSRVRAAFGARIDRLPPDTRAALLIAAADDTGDLAVVLRAADTTLDALEAAETADLIRLDSTGLTFRHPLVRAAAYRSATLARRIAAHRALADSLDGEKHADRRAWHRAAASTAPDESVARELDRAAERATGRQGTASASAAHERASQLSPDPADRQRRLLAAAQAAADAGQFQRVAALLERGGAAADSAELARVQAALELNEGSAVRAVDVLLAAEDAGPAIVVEAFHAAQSAGVPALVERVAARARREPAGPHGTLAAVAALYDDSPQVGPRPFEAAAKDSELLFSERYLAAHAGHALADHRLAGDLAALLLAHCRAQGLLGWQATSLHLLAETQLALGELESAGRSAAEGLRIAQYAGLDHRACYLRTTLATCAAVEGDEARSRELAETALSHATAHQLGTAALHAHRALALTALATGDPAHALAHLDRLPEGPPALHALLLPDLVEAAARTGSPRPDTTARLDTWAARSGHPAAAALAARCRALTDTDNHAEDHFTTAVALATQAGTTLELARTRLLHGEWLRRRKRRSDARRVLREALETFEKTGARPWAERARAELRGTGEVIDATSATGTPLGRLTPQEREVVRLAATGHSNREIAAQLFLSPRTVGHHLYRAFPKLGVASRDQLAGTLGM